MATRLAKGVKVGASEGGVLSQASEVLKKIERRKKVRSPLLGDWFNQIFLPTGEFFEATQLQ